MIPIVICFDVEPDGHRLDTRPPRRWVAFEEALAFADRLRGLLAPLSDTPIRFAWFLRMDPQIESAYGNAAYVADAYARQLAGLREQGDVLGVHPHAWRWSERHADWVADHGDWSWVGHCLDVSLAAHRDAFGSACRIHRFGDRFMDGTILRRLRDEGVRVDLTVEPGARPRRSLHRGVRATGATPDYSAAPREPYIPRLDDPIRRSKGGDAALPWFLPLSAADPSVYRSPSWRVARRIRYPLRPGHRPVYLDSALSAPAFADLLEAELRRSPRPYLAFAVRTSPRPTGWTPLADKLCAIARRLRVRDARFVDPESAVTHLTSGL